MQFKKTALAVLSVLALVACGGGDDGPRYDKLVSFGDSLSDVGSYKTAGIAALGGGKYTVNGPEGLVWVEQLASKLGLAAPCAAETGLEASGVFRDFAGPVTPHPNCTAYGQGGSRVTNPIGPWNKALLASPDPSQQFSGQLGQLTVPVTTQIVNHLAANGGRFSGKELVTVLAGANDVFVNADAVANATSPEDAQAKGAAAVAAMAQAGVELATLIKTQIVAKGATHVVVLNLPNISNIPASVAAGPIAQALTDAMTQAFNAQLKNGLGTDAAVLQVDLYTQNTDQVANPAKYGLTNVTTPACNNQFPNAPGFLAPSLVCTTATTIAGDVSHFLFADDVHPTPYGHSLLRDMTLSALKTANWD